MYDIKKGARLSTVSVHMPLPQTILSVSQDILSDCVFPKLQRNTKMQKAAFTLCLFVRNIKWLSLRKRGN